jgi:hypothetical protein
MPNENNATGDETYPKVQNHNPKEEHISDGIRGKSDDDNSQDYKNSPRRTPKPSIAVRIWRSLWRRRIFWRHAPHRPKASWAEIITICITVAIIVLGSVQAFIYWKQESVMEESLMQTGAQLALTNRTARTAEDTLQEARNEQRPWIVVKEAKITTLELNKKVDVDLILSNFGHSPGLDARFTSSLFITSEPGKDIPPIAKVEVNSAIAAPGLDMHFSLHSVDALPASEVERAKLPDVRYYVYGQGTYRDTSARQGLHHTEFCIFLTYGFSGITPCPDNMRYKNTAD